MAKLHKHEPFGSPAQYWFFCPGCECSHAFTVPPWTFNGSDDAPTFVPSLLCNKDDPATRCHLFMTNGTIQFLPDCHHKLAGKVVSVPEWEGF